MPGANGNSVALFDLGVQALAEVAIIERRGLQGKSEIVFYRMLPEAGPVEDQLRLEAVSREQEALIFELGQHDGLRYAILRQRDASRVTRWHVGLLLATIATTLSSGAIMAGHDIFASPATILYGWPFSLSLLGILGVHEFGHYYFGIRHKVDVSLPYFIPVPPPLTHRRSLWSNAMDHTVLELDASSRVSSATSSSSDVLSMVPL